MNLGQEKANNSSKVFSSLQRKLKKRKEKKKQKEETKLLI